MVVQGLVLGWLVPVWRGLARAGLVCGTGVRDWCAGLVAGGVGLCCAGRGARVRCTTVGCGFVELQLDGSVQLVDADGNEAGIIATPWALDATGAEIPTSFALDGSTLVQTVNHHGATYPVIADPCGWSWRGALDRLTVAAAAVLVVPACAPPVAIATCGPAVIVATYTYVSIQHPPSPPPPPTEYVACGTT